MTTCASCGKPMPDQAVICRDETDLLADDLRHLGGWTTSDGRHTDGLLADLLTTGTRTDRIPRQVTPGDDDAHTLDSRYAVAISTAASPANLAALDLHHAIRNSLSGWIRVLLEQDHRVSLPVIRFTRCGFLLDHVDQIRRRDWALDMLNDISGQDGLTVRAMRLVDRPPGVCRIPCPTCGERVPIEPDATITRCTCGEWGTLQWWVERVAPASPEPMRLSALPAWLLLRGIIVTVDQLRQWADRERITPVQSAGNGSARLFDPAAVLVVADQTRGIRRTTALLRT